MLDDTIAAIATPLGEGGLAVIRISGSQALSVADACFRSPRGSAPRPSQRDSHTVHYGFIELEGKRVDEVLLTVMRAPRTFTREDVVEISCHGGMVPTQRVLQAVMRAGARLAEPGEFTRRAFLNGRIDLTQAEAVADVIHARTDRALAAAHAQLSGRLSRRIVEVRDQLMKVLAHLEAHIDFPDEDIAPDTRQQLVDRLSQALAFVDGLLDTAREGQLLRRGIRVAIVGRPNAGKSSLLNQLLGRDRAIVSPQAGTTRDTIEEIANVRGIPVIFVDTAGLRDSTDLVEREGIRRSRESLEQAELVLHVVDPSVPADPSTAELDAQLSGRVSFRVLNKCDLGDLGPVPMNGLKVSCLTGEGIEALKDAIVARVWSGAIQGDMAEAMINARHQEALIRAREALIHARTALGDGLTLELASMELRIAVNAVGEVVGQTATEDLLDVIFSQFCIGK